MVAAPAEQPAAAAKPGPSGFSPQVRLGFHAGDQWEPAIAADDYGSVYVLYPQYGGVPGCPAAIFDSPTAILQVSRDRGATWGSPHPAAPSGTDQVDTQIEVDPVDGRTRCAALTSTSVDKGPERIYFARSEDGGATWSPRAEVSRAPSGVAHAFPALAAGAPGDLRISWMDARIAIDDRGDSQLIWGEGLNWDSPSSIWYARGR